MSVARILIIDGHRSVQDIEFGEFAHAGCETLTADRGFRTLDLLRESLFDLVILDLGIIATACASLSAVVRRIHEKTIDYLIKPCSGEDLLARVNLALARHQQARQQHQIIGLLTDFALEDQIRPL